MSELEALRRLKSSLSSISIALTKTRARERELMQRREDTWFAAEAQGLANRASLAKLSGVDPMLVSRALNKEKS